MTRFVKWCLGTSVASGTALASTLTIPEVLPATPEGFGTWHVTSLLAYVCIVGFLVLGGVCYMLFRAMLSQSTSLRETAVAMAAQTQEMARSNSQTEITQQHLITLNLAIKSRPCLDEKYTRYLRLREEAGEVI